MATNISVGTRNQPEKDMDRIHKPNSFQRISRKILKQWQNRKARRLAKLDPESPPLPKYNDYEW